MGETLQTQQQHIKIIGFSANPDNQQPESMGENVSFTCFGNDFSHSDFMACLRQSEEDKVLLIDLDRIPASSVPRLIQDYRKGYHKKGVYYLDFRKNKRWLGFIDPKICGGNRGIIDTPVLVGERDLFLNAYAGKDLDPNLLRSVAYSLEKNYTRFYNLESGISWEIGEKKPSPARNYFFKVPFAFIMSASFFKTINRSEDRVKRQMVYRMLMLLFGLFVMVYMPYISKDYGISGDEYVDHRHSGLVIDFFTKGDKAALNQPKTTLHLYGNVMQVVSAGIAKVTGAHDVYRVRHFVCAVTGALGILFAGFLGLRFGGAGCGLIAMVLLFFSPRYFGHSMNNLKDIPFAVGYLMAIFYFIRLFDRYPVVKLRHMIGAMFGITLALGTRSGGLLLFPYLLMYGGLFYILWVGWSEFYKFVKYKKEIENIALLIISVLVAGYILSILLWPFALAKPLSNVVVSLREFTNYSLGLRTIFEGKQVMSNMLPMHYAPKYLMIASPLVVVIGFIGYLVSLIFCRKQFSLQSFFLLFAIIFPVFWVIYKESNLYGGIRHMLFVMPLMVVLAARFWNGLLSVSYQLVRWISLGIFILLLIHPVRHMANNHPNDYVYFNELVGGLRGAYGDYETDYYYNSMKKATDWFKENIDYKGKPITIITNHSNNLDQYFRNDTNVKIIYGRYYEKFEKDWDYMIFSNVYISSYQLKNGLYPVQEGLLYTVDVDEHPMIFVGERVSKEDLEALRLQEEDPEKAALMLEHYLSTHDWNEEMWMRLSRIYSSLNKPEEVVRAANESLKRNPQLMDALMIKAINEAELGNIREAHLAVDNMLAQNDIAASSYYLKGLIYSKEYKDKEAIDQLNKALRYQPKLEQALVLAGDILKRNGNYAQAVKPYESVVQLKKANEKTLLSLADCYSRVGNKNAYQQVITLLERDGKDHYGIMKVKIRDMLARQLTAEAGALLAQSETHDEDVEWVVLKAIFELQNGRRGTAEGLIEKAISLDPRNIDALQLKRNLASGQRNK